MGALAPSHAEPRRAGRFVGLVLMAGLSGCVVFPKAKTPPSALAPRVLTPPAVALELDEPSQPELSLTLPRALTLADQNNPRLLQMRARVTAARAGREIAFAEFLPDANVTFRHIRGSPSDEPFALPTLPTLVGNVAFGGTSDAFSTAELHLQWTVFDFGRTLGRFGQATAAAEIAELQCQRARQTVAFNVAAAWFGVLRTRTERRIAEEAVARAESILRDARNFLERGAGIPNEVMRAEVLLAEARLQLVRARTAEGVAHAALVQELGVNQPFQIADQNLELAVCRLVPGATVAEALRVAVDNRPEFQAALRSIDSARLGEGVAKADFLPKVVAGATAAHQDMANHPDANLLSGGVGIELGLFEGGRRTGRLRAARAEVSVAVGQGQEICDRIAFEAKAAYLQMADARERINLARTDLTHATENIRVVRRLFDKGDATPTDVVDADLALVRAQENEAAALYDYQTAVARLAYALGVPVELNEPTPAEVADGITEFAIERK